MKKCVLGPNVNINFSEPNPNLLMLVKNYQISRI